MNEKIYEKKKKEKLIILYYIYIPFFLAPGGLIFIVDMAGTDL